MNYTTEAKHIPPVDDDLIFADEDQENIMFSKDEASKESQEVENQEPWKILIADDEEEVHSITQLVLEDYIFHDRGLELLHAYTGAETKKILSENPDIAIILLDVVMETDGAGLEAVRYIREDLANNFVRIILRTGQPGKAATMSLRVAPIPSAILLDRVFINV